MTTLQIQTAPALKPLLQPSRYKAIHGGRGSMKSHFFAELAIERCILLPGTRIVCVREVQKSLKESAKRLLEDKISRLGVSDNFRVLNNEIITPGGGIIVFQGMADHTAESVKSLEGFDIAWVEEGQTLSQRSLEFLRPTIRKDEEYYLDTPHQDESELWFGWNPRDADDPVDKLFRGEHLPPRSIVVETSWRDNPWFPKVLEDERAYDEKFNAERYEHIWEGAYEPQAIGSLWSRSTFRKGRLHEVPGDLKEIVVSIDPAISNEEHSDEHGITVCGLGYDQKGYMLEDGSFKGSPRQCAQRAVALHDKWGASSIIYEKNNGDKWIKTTIESVRRGLKVIAVNATRGKYIRAEPIASLYELGIIHHVGEFTKLEGQMCLMVSGDYAGKGSPDRVCSAVWGFTKLFPQLVKAPPKPERVLNIPALPRL